MDSMQRRKRHLEPTPLIIPVRYSCGGTPWISINSLIISTCTRQLFSKHFSKHLFLLNPLILLGRRGRYLLDRAIILFHIDAFGSLRRHLEVGTNSATLSITQCALGDGNGPSMTWFRNNIGVVLACLGSRR